MVRSTRLLRRLTGSLRKDRSECKKRDRNDMAVSIETIELKCYNVGAGRVKFI